MPGRTASQRSARLASLPWRGFDDDEAGAARWAARTRSARGNPGDGRVAAPEDDGGGLLGVGHPAAAPGQAGPETCASCSFPWRRRGLGLPSGGQAVDPGEGVGDGGAAQGGDGKRSARGRRRAACPGQGEGSSQEMGRQPGSAAPLAGAQERRGQALGVATSSGAAWALTQMAWPVGWAGSGPPDWGGRLHRSQTAAAGDAEGAGGDDGGHGAILGRRHRPAQCHRVRPLTPRGAGLLRRGLAVAGRRPLKAAAKPGGPE